MGTANPKAAQLVQHYGSAKEAYEAVAEGHDMQFLSPVELKRLPNASLENSERILEACRKSGIKTVALGAKGYPFRLQNIYNPPLVLFYKGNINGLDDEICIAGVGARGATEYTAKLTRRTCMDLAKMGVVLVSGMAVGVDHIVHQSAIDAGGRTIGVLACGLAVDYPRGSLSTRERIYELGGACISELFPTAEPSRTYFQARNRIISGLSSGVMIFQASMQSGSLITASHAIQQGRDLFCVPPGDIFSPVYSGVVGLLRDGAIPLFNYLDVVNCYYSSFNDKLNALKKDYEINPDNRFIFSRAEESKADVKPTKTKKKEAPDEEIKKETKSKRSGEEAAENYDFGSQEPEYRRIYEYLRDNGTQTIESITNDCGVSPDDVSLYLLDMEIAGILEARPGAKYAVKE